MNSNISSLNSPETLENPSTITSTLGAPPTVTMPLYKTISEVQPILIPLTPFSIKDTMEVKENIFTWSSDSPLPENFNVNFNYMIYNTHVRGTYEFELHFKIFKIPGCQLSLRWGQYYSSTKNESWTPTVPVVGDLAIDTGVWQIDENIEFSKEICLPWNGLTTPLQYPVGEGQFGPDQVPTYQNIPRVVFKLWMANKYVPTSLQPKTIDVRPYVIFKPVQTKDFLMGSYKHITSSPINRTIPI